VVAAAEPADSLALEWWLVSAAGLFVRSGRASKKEKFRHGS
jgi:hypothetical protein